MKGFYPAHRNFFKTRTIDVAFTIILGLFTFIFGYYVFTSIQNFKAAKAKKALVASTVPHYKMGRRKKKHRYIVSAKSLYPKVSVADTTKVLPSQQIPVVQAPIQTSVAQPQVFVDKNSIGSPTIAATRLDEVEPVIDNPGIEKQPVKEASLPYTTYLRANETGVINMRKLDNYGSEIIKVIPTHSEVAVLERGNIYYKVFFQNTTGYVARWNVLKK